MMTAALSLEDHLERAERDLVCARMIDNTNRMWAEITECERRIAAIKRQISERDERQHVENAVSALGDRHAG